jgi:YD repeat-containing protein
MGDDDNGFPLGGVPGPAGAGFGGFGPNLFAAAGMPVWKVSEPYINLHLYDQPIGYQPGIGPRVSFTLAYKQRGSPLVATNIYSLGTNWTCSWLSYVEDDGVGSQATLILKHGGRVVFAPPDGSTVEYYTRTTLLRQTNTNGQPVFVRTFPSGASDYYLFVPAHVTLPDGHTPVFLTARTDPSGHTNLVFAYEETPVSGGYVLQLTSVTDADGRVTALSYTNSNLSLITGVADPFGRNAVLRYDGSGRLTNVTDAAGLSSSFGYDPQNWITNLATPYGATTFEHLDNGFTNSDGSINEGVIRAVRVVDPVGGTNIYMLHQDTAYLDNFASINGLDGPPTGIDLPFDSYYPVQFDYYYVQYRESFHWSPRQSPALPLDMNTITNSDFISARIRHWLHADTNCNPQFISQSLSLQVEPSPDGVNLGQATWYVYDGMYCTYHVGTNSLPALAARVLPDSTVWYTSYQRDQWGRPIAVTDTYSAGYDQTPITRTYQYTYDGPDLTSVTGPRGETLAGYVYTNHLLLRATNAVGDVTSYTYDSQGRLTSVHTPAGLTRTNIYFASGPYTNSVQTTIDLEISRTNSYTYTNDLVYTHTDERGLTTAMQYDNLNRLTNSANPLGAVSYVYDKLDLVSVVDRLGFTTSYAYDAVRRRIAETNALGRVTHYNYCACGALDSIRDAAGNYTYFSYDNAGRRVQTIYPDSYTVHYTYDSISELTNTYDNAGQSLTNWFDNQGLLYYVQDAGGTRSALVFDDEDRITNSCDANAVCVSMTYDNLGRLLTRTYPDGGTESFGYSPAGLVAYTNQLGYVTLYTYDPARRKVGETNANAQVTSYSYNAAGDLRTLTDPNPDISRSH